jgi:serine/threonine protein phosphatase 1
MKTLVVGDIQGCFTEFQELLGITAPDKIVAVGDLVDRGPDSPAVLNFFRTSSISQSVMGNHEWKHIHTYESGTNTSVAVEMVRTQIGKESYGDAIQYMRTLPSFLELPEALVIHAFWEPGVPLNRQRHDVLVGVSTGESYIREICARPWWELYDEDKPLIVGHHDYSKCGVPLVHQNRVFCIDTGCCYGRALTGLILPDFQLVSVPAKTNYWAQIRQKYN